MKTVPNHTELRAVFIIGWLGSLFFKVGGDIVGEIVAKQYIMIPCCLVSQLVVSVVICFSTCKPFEICRFGREERGQTTQHAVSSLGSDGGIGGSGGGGLGVLTEQRHADHYGDDGRV
jgi:hypothetical protein